MRHLDIRVSGRVQGVTYRRWAKSLANVLGICGFAENKSDGSVLIEAEGEKQALDQFIRRCWEGPELAQVEKVEVKEGQLKNYKDFSTR